MSRAGLGRVMLGGRQYKIIREEPQYPWDVRAVGAFEEGDDLVVSKKVFDAFEDAFTRGFNCGIPPDSVEMESTDDSTTVTAMNEEMCELDSEPDPVTTNPLSSTVLPLLVVGVLIGIGYCTIVGIAKLSMFLIRMWIQ